MIACYSDSEILQRVDAVLKVRAQIHRLETTISFRRSRVVGPGKDFVVILIRVDLRSGLSPECNPLTFIHL